MELISVCEPRRIVQLALVRVRRVKPACCKENSGREVVRGWGIGCIAGSVEEVKTYRITLVPGPRCCLFGNQYGSTLARAKNRAA